MGGRGNESDFVLKILVMLSLAVVVYEQKEDEFHSSTPIQPATAAHVSHAAPAGQPRKHILQMFDPESLTMKSQPRRKSGCMLMG